MAASGRVPGRLLGLGVGVFALSGRVRAHDVGGASFQTTLSPATVVALAVTTVLITGGIVVARRSWHPPKSVRSITLSRGWGIAIVAGVVQGGFLVAAIGVLLYGVVGPRIAAENVATVFTWPVWVTGVAVLSVAVGHLWPLLSPWGTLYDVLEWLEGASIAVVGPYPSWLGSWPAVIGVVALIGIVEPLTIVPVTPALTTVVLGLLFLWMVGGGVLFGRAWFVGADPLRLYYEVLGRVSPVRMWWHDDAVTVVVRPLWQGCVERVDDYSMVVGVAAVTGSVGFDAFVGTPVYRDLVFGLAGPLGSTAPASLIVFASVLLALIAAIRVVSGALARVGDTPSWQSVSTAVVPSVIPITAGLVVAHNWARVLDNVARLVGLLVPGVSVGDPLWWLSATGLVWSQVGLLVVGHSVAVLAGGAIVEENWSTPRRRSAVWVLLGFVNVVTVAAIWVVGQPTIGG